MKNNLKKALSVVLVLLIMLTSAPLQGFVGLELPEWFGDPLSVFANAEAEVLYSGECGENLSWSLDSEGILTISGEGRMPDYIHPELMSSYSTSDAAVMSLESDTATVEENMLGSGLEFDLKIEPDHSGMTADLMNSAAEISEDSEQPTEFAPWLDYCDKIKYVVVEDGITNISTCAFFYCANLESAILADSVKEIGHYAFAACLSLESVNLQKVETIGTYAFMYATELKSAVLENVETISENAFSYCTDMYTVTFSDKLKTIDEGAFGACINLTKIIIPESVESIGRYAFGEMILLQSIENKSLVAFSADSIEFMISSADIDNAEKCAFIMSESMKIQLRAELLGESLDEEKLISTILVKFNEKYGVSYSIEEFMEFVESQDTSGGFPTYFAIRCYENSVEHEKCKTTGVPHILFGESELHICYEFKGVSGDLNWEIDLDTRTLTFSGNGAMADYYNYGEKAPWSKLTSFYDKVEFAEDSTVTRIGNAAFYDIGLREIELPSTLTSIGNYAFQYCNFENIVIPASVASIGYSAFAYNKGLVSVSFEENSAMTYFNSNIFSDCSSLESVDIPAGINSISSGVFNGCDALQTLNIHPDNNSFTCDNGILFNKSKTNVIFCLRSKKGDVVIPASVTSVNYDAFERCNYITSLSFEENSSITNISYFARYCDALETVTLPKSLVSIYDSFFSCPSLTSILVEEGSSSFYSENGVLYNADKTTLINYPGGKSGAYEVLSTVNMINRSAFSHCAKLTEVILPEGLKTIGSSAFSYCDLLTDVVVPESVTNIGYDAFYRCSELKKITINNPNCVIGGDAIQKNTIIKGYTASTAHDYSNLYGVDFESIDGRTIESISIETLPNKTKYTTKSSFKNAGLSIKVNLSGGTSIIKSESLHIFGFDSSEPGVCTVTVEYAGHKATFDVEIYELNSEILLGETIQLAIDIGDKAYIKFVPGFTGDFPLVFRNSPNNNYYYSNDFSISLCDENKSQIGSNSYVYFYGSNEDYVTYSLEEGNTYYFFVEHTYGVDGATFDVTLRCGHATKTEHEGIPSDCTNTGFTAGVFCEDCKQWVSGHEVIDYKHIDENKDFICDLCNGDAKQLLVSGNCGINGDNIKWYLYDSGLLELIGTGEMKGYSFENAPWYKYSDSMNNYEGIAININKVKVSDGITNIGAGAFYSLSYLTDVFLPESLTSVGDYCFNMCNNLKEIILPDGVTVIGEGAFYSCNNLKSISLFDSVTTIKSYAFYDCNSLAAITIPESVTSIGSWAFYNCNKLTAVIIPEGVTTIESNTFNNCHNLTKITIPGSVTGIGSGAFYYCNKLTEVIIPEGVTTIESNTFNNCYNLTEITIPDSVTSIGSSAFSGCGNLKKITIPASVSVGYHSDIFYGCSSISEVIITKGNGVMNFDNRYSYYRYDTPWCYNNIPISVTIEDGVTEISSRAFYGSSVSDIVIPDSVSVIGSYAFYNCDRLTEITMPGSVINIDYEAFYGCNNLSVLRLPVSLTNVSNYAFYGCESLACVFYEGTEDEWKNITIGTYNTPLTEAVIVYSAKPDETVVLAEGDCNDSIHWTVYSDGLLTLEGSGVMPSYNNSNTPWYKFAKFIRSITVSDGITTIGQNAFYGFINLNEISIPKSVADIYAGAFYNCDRITEIIIPGNITAIGNEAFYSCGNLEKVAFSGSVNSIGRNAFSYCTSLTEINFPDAMESIGSSAFSNCIKLNEIAIPEGIKVIGDYTFSGCSSLTGITLPESLETIGAGAFASCAKLTEITIPENVSDIYPGQFYDCASLEKIAVDDKNGYYCDVDGILFNKDKTTLIRLPENHSATAYTVPDDVKLIDTYAFSECNKLTEIIIPDSVTSVGSSAFNSCSNLKKVSVHAGLLYQSCAFSGCSNISEVYIRKGNGTMADFSSSYDNKPWGASRNNNPEIILENGITNIGAYAFYYNTFSNITIPESVTKIGDYAFYSCSNLKNITLPDNVNSIGNYAFSNCSSFKSFVIPEETETIGSGALYNCSALINITISGKVKTIGSDAFYGCKNLTEITIPASVTNISNNLFVGCDNLKNIYVEEGNSNFVSGNGVLYNKDKTLIYCFPVKNSQTEFILPDSVTAIGAYAFHNCGNLESIDFSDSLITIGERAFYNCSSLTEINIPDSVTNIGSNSFGSCISLTKIKVPASAIYYSSAFTDSSAITEIIISKGNGKMADFNSTTYQYTPWYVYSKDYPDILIEDGVTSIGAYAFYNYDRITTIDIPDSVTSIGNYAFSSNDSIKSMIIPNSVTSVGIGAFQYCDELEKLSIPCSTVIGSDAFYMCNALGDIAITKGNGVMTDFTKSSSSYKDTSTYKHTPWYLANNYGNNPNITLEEGITYIGDYAFCDCDSFTNIKIPESITGIGYNAFYKSEPCSVSVYIEDLEAWCGITFDGSASNPLFRYSSNSSYSSTLYINGVAESNIVIPDTMTEIKPHTFYNCTSVKTVSISDNVTEIGSCAFDNCKNIESVTIGDGVTAIGYRAFYDCNTLTSITLGKGVKTIGNDAFNYSGETHRSVSISDLDVWCNIDFSNLSSNPLYNSFGSTLYVEGVPLINMTIPDTVTSIKPNAFNCCVLETVIIPKSVTFIGSSAFSNCYALTSVTIPDSVTKIDEYAFKYCSALNEIKIYNPDCVIDYNSYTISETATIYGYANSTAQQYATKYNRTFIELPCPHSEQYVTEHEEVPATCTEDGVTAGKFCEYCETWIEGHEKITAKGHVSAEDWTLIKEPTCTEEGVESTCCTVCYKTGKEWITGDPSDYPETPHSYSNSQTYNYVYKMIGAEKLLLKFSSQTLTESTYDKIYIYDAVGNTYGPYSGNSLTSKEIEINGDSFTIRLTTDGSVVKYGFSFDYIKGYFDVGALLRSVPALGHEYDESWTVDVKETCETNGSKSRHCIRCKDFTDTEVIPALGHDYSTEFTVDIKETCTVNGSKSRHCSRCSSTVDVTVIDATGHNYSSAVVAPECEADGYTKHTCQKCRDTYNDTIVSALGHEYNVDWTVDKVATCEEEGSKSRHCTRCKDFVDTEIIPALGHNYSEEFTVDKNATCTVDGSKSRHCSRCESITDVTVIEATGHNYDSVVTEPTCTTDGFTTHTCSKCKDTFTDSTVAALGHEYNADWTVDKKSTCEADGLKSRHCSRCKDYTDTEVIPALGHDYSEEFTVDKKETCTEDGSKSHHCRRCDGKTDITVIKASGHNYSIETVSVTCTTDGYTRYTCSNCRDTYTDNVIKSEGHKYNSVTVEPTCTKEGYTTHVCTVCNSGYSDSRTPATGHKFGDWAIIKDATIFDEGLKERICNICTFVDKETIDKINIDVDENENYGIVNFKVVNAQSLDPIDGASLFISTEKEGETTLFTDKDGKVSVILPVGSVNVSAFSSGLQVRNIKVDVKPGENVVPEIGLSSSDIYDAELTSKEMTIDEIEKAGIDVSDPENSNVEEYELKLQLDPQIDFASIKFYYEDDVLVDVITSNPEDDGMAELHYHIVGSGASHHRCKRIDVEEGTTVELDYMPNFPENEYEFDGWYEDSACTKKITHKTVNEDVRVYGKLTYIGTSTAPEPPPPVPVVVGDKSVYPVSEKMYLIINGSVSWLKEMFDVQLLIVNNSKTDSLGDLHAELELPDGLSLAKMLNREQSLSVDLAPISEGGFGTANWYIKGDKEGSYDLSASLTGKIYPFGETINEQFVLQDSISVLSGKALNINFEVPNAVYYGYDFPLRITLENVSDKTIYNLSHILTSLEQTSITHYSDGKIINSMFMHEEDNLPSEFVREFKPGDSIVFELDITAKYISKLIKYKIEQLKKQIDEFEKVYKTIKVLDAVGDLIGSITSIIEVAAGNAVDAFMHIPGQKAELAYEIFAVLRDILSVIKEVATNPEVVKVLSGGQILFDIVGLFTSPTSIVDWFNDQSLDSIKNLLGDLKSLYKSLNDAKAIRDFNLFDSLRTAISAIPVSFVLEDVIFKSESSAGTNEIPKSYTVVDNGYQYFGVVNVSRYIQAFKAVIADEVYDMAMPGWIQLVPGCGDITNSDEAKLYIKATEERIEEIQVIRQKNAENGTVRYRSWIETNEPTTYSLRRSSTDDLFELSSSDNETAKFENGVLTFEGSATLEIVPKSTVGGILHIEGDDGTSVEVEIDVVEQHECNSDVFHSMIPPVDGEKGYGLKCCSICEEIIDVVELDSASCGENHNFGEWEVIVEAECDASEIKSRSCELCGYVDTVFGDATGHTEKTINVVEATCTEPGYSGDVVCDVCGDTISEGESITALGHEFDESSITKQPTCTESGEAKGKCKRCDEYSITVLDPIAHSYGSVVKAPSCTEKGYTTYTCNVCGDSYSDDYTDMLEHSYETIVTKPTCTEQGYTTYTCSVCGDSYSDDYTDMLEHSYETVVTKPTCAERGFTTYICTVCGTGYTSDFVEKTGHTGGKANCVELAVCESCGATYGEYSKDEHKSIVTDKAIVPTCTECGLTEGSHCDACDKVIVAQGEIDKLSHKYESIITEPSCTEKGFTTYTCINCDDSYMTDYTNTVDHDYNQSGVCMICGANRSDDCSCNCHKGGISGFFFKIGLFFQKIFKTNKICKCGVLHYGKADAHVHAYISETVIEATCTVSGELKYTCSCGMSYNEAIEPLGHDEYITDKIPATCTQSGLNYYKCLRCEETRTEEVKETGHNEIEVSEVAATCLASGLTAGKYCDICNFVIVEQKEVPAKGHTVVTVPTIEPTCVDNGYTESEYCSVCNVVFKEREELKALGHIMTLDADNFKKENCTEDGAIVEKCSREGCTYTVTQVVAATGHIDADCDQICDNCSIDMINTQPDSPEDPADNCNCSCHKGGITGFFFKFGLFFQKIFKTNKVCKCGVEHY